MTGDIPYYGASGIIDHVNDYLFDEPALLIAEDGANLLARTTPIAFLANGRYWVNNHAHVVTSNGMADPEFLLYAIELRDMKEYITGSAQPKLNQAMLNSVPVAVPPVELQEQFTQRLRQINETRHCRLLEANRLVSLFDALASSAFV